ncbi:cupredoxin family copper-binding protein [Methyloceanibacter sp.]|uniref:cupredoxin domain-containing protein n=1 Tax=Methyloceanibacter sp. TaxID=1965321 RepID=UPI002D237B7D|nr:cupredoxin family copper-binding protein [Methyloceanibacter sp.]HZP09593.1 cupredoxin family copper-binding protein [Methyloceanibacter sp.]
MTKVRSAIMAALAGATISLAASGALAADAEVKIANFTFDPPTVTIKAGGTVTWINADDIPHVVAEKEGKFRSAALDTDDRFSQSFTTPGTVEYFCAIHPHMTGKIVVTP